MRCSIAESCAAAIVLWDIDSSLPGEGFMTNRTSIATIIGGVLGSVLAGCGTPHFGPTLPGCADGVKNDDETDTDCGGSCPACAGGRVCVANGDCVSGGCIMQRCAVRTDICFGPPMIIPGTLAYSMAIADFNRDAIP